MPPSKKYDLYIAQGCNELPELSDLASSIPAVTYPAFLQSIVMDRADIFGFLHLDLEKTSALTLLERLRTKSAKGFIVDAAYRQPKLSYEEAHTVALKEVPKVWAANPDIVFEELNFTNMRATTYDFIVLSKQLAVEGYAPSGVFIHVDKLDGHIWHEKDFIAWYTEN